jgi:hypothetical protein
MLLAMAPLGVMAAEGPSTGSPDGAIAVSQGPTILNAEEMDTVNAGRNVHIHPNSDVPADGLGLPDAAGNAVDNTGASVLGDHE